MVDAIKDIAPAALADSIVSDPVAVPVAMTEPVAAPEVVNAPEAIAAKPKGKPGRPRKVATPAAVAGPVSGPVSAPIKAPKAKPAPKAEVVPDQAAAQALPVSAPKRAKPAGRKPAKATTPKITPAKSTAAKSTPAITTPAITTGVAIKARKIATALPRSATPKQKDIFIMTATTTEMTETIQTAMKDAAEKAKAALEKSQAALGDMGAFTKGNMEAVVESSKILATGLQEMGKSYAAETKSVVETMTAEIKDLASVKSPAEFFEKQNAMLRKQFDAAMAVSSKNSEAMLKLASEAFQPISNRVSLAVEKIKQAA